MGINTSIILGDHFDQFVKSEIESGRYNSASEVIRTGLRLIEDESKKTNLINEALVVGEQSGASIEFDNEQFKKRMRNKYASNA